MASCLVIDLNSPVLETSCADLALLPPSAFMVVVAELRQGPAQRVLRKRNSSGKASSDAGPELAGRAAERRWKARRP